MKLRRRRRRMETTVELNITAFMNLMVILVPFLLITAVFSRMTVLELNLPALNAKSEENKEIKLQLQILVTEDLLTVQDANLGVFRKIARTDSGQAFDDIERKVWKPLREILLELKNRFPEEQNITLLIDKPVSYNTMIAIMDRVRAADVTIAATLESVELFPNISIGDIPQQADVLPESNAQELPNG